jgi:hypothetical protein
VPGLAFAVPQLTISEAEFLLAVSVECFRACPTTAIGFHDAFRIPEDAIRHEYLARFGIVFISPQDHDANLVLDVRHLHVHGQIPLLRAVARYHLLAILRRNRFRELHHFLLDAFMDDVAIELQIADVAATRSVRVFQAFDVIQNFRRRIKTVERERTEHAFFVAPVDQLKRELRHFLELFACPFALLGLFEPAKFQRIMLAARRMHVVDDDQILRMNVTLLRMIPEHAAVLDVLAGLFEQDIVECDDAAIMKLHVVEVLQPFDTFLVELLRIPIDLGQKPIQTRLIGGVRLFAGHPRNGFVRTDHQAGQIIGHMIALRLIRKKLPDKFSHRVLNDDRRRDNRHRIPSLSAA